MSNHLLKFTRTIPYISKSNLKDTDLIRVYAQKIIYYSINRSLEIELLIYIFPTVFVLSGLF